MKPPRSGGKNGTGGFDAVYSMEDRIRFFKELKRSNGNVAFAARAAQVPVTSARYWLKTMKINEVDEETAAIIRTWRGTVETHLDHLLFEIFEEAGRKLKSGKLSLDDTMKAAERIVKMKNTLAGKQRSEPSAEDELEKDGMEDEALSIIQAAEKRRRKAEARDGILQTEGTQ